MIDGGSEGERLSLSLLEWGDNREFAVKGVAGRCSPRAEACGMSEAARAARPVPNPPLCPLIKPRNWIPGVAALSSFTV